MSEQSSSCRPNGGYKVKIYGKKENATYET